MIRILMLVLALAVFAIPVAHAERLIVDGLTEEQAAKLQLKAAQMKMTPHDTGVTTRMAEYAELGQKYGIALAATAKELGIAADELLDTTIGKVGLVLIVWKVMGDDLLGVLVGVPYMMMGFLAWFYMFRRMCVIASVTREPVEGRWLRLKTVTYHPPSSDTTWNTRWVMLLSLIVCVFLPSFFMIFG